MKTRIAKFLAIFALSALGACASAPTEPTAPSGGVTSPRDVQRAGSTNKPVAPVIDLPLLERKMGLDRNLRELGYEEKSFDPCNEGVSSPPNCAKMVMISVHFRLQCRMSEGTVEMVDPAEIQAIHSEAVRWNLGKIDGTTTTDFEGYGQVLAVAPRSQKRERFRLTSNGQFLVITAESVGRVVAPGSWCH